MDFDADLLLKAIQNHAVKIRPVAVGFLFHPQSERILSVAVIDNDLVFAAYTGYVLQNAVHLPRIDIHALYLDHVVGSSDYPVNHGIASAAGAFFRDNPCQIVGAVANQRSPLLPESGNHKFPKFAIGQDFSRITVDNLKVEEIVKKCMPL